MVEIECKVSGKVQNVAYRAYVQDAANELDITGWVKNCADGTVQIVAQGTPDILKDFIEYLNEGSLSSQVSSVSVDWQTPKKVYDDFSIKH